MSDPQPQPWLSWSLWHEGKRYTAALHPDDTVDVMQGDRLVGKGRLQRGALVLISGAALLPPGVIEGLEDARPSAAGVGEGPRGLAPARAGGPR